MRRGMNLNRLLPALAGYLGQVDLTSTERFLLLTPERFRSELDKLSPLQGRPWSSHLEAMSFLAKARGHTGRPAALARNGRTYPETV
jgi:integrase/recombinase XerD